MVTGQHHDVLGVAALDDVDVLVDGVGRATVPVFLVQALLGRQQVDHFVQFGAQKAPAALQMAQQRVRLVLGDDTHAADAGVDAVGQRKVNDAELAAKVHRRFGAAVGQLLQARAAPPGQHQGDGAAHQHVRLHHAVMLGVVGGVYQVHKVSFF